MFFTLLMFVSFWSCSFSGFYLPRCHSISGIKQNTQAAFLISLIRKSLGHNILTDIKFWSSAQWVASCKPWCCRMRKKQARPGLNRPKETHTTNSYSVHVKSKGSKWRPFFAISQSLTAPSLFIRNAFNLIPFLGSSILPFRALLAALRCVASNGRPAF